MPTLMSLNTPVSELHKFKIARLGETTSHKLATALAGFFNKRSGSEATVEDLLLPSLRSRSFKSGNIRDLKDCMDVLELYVKIGGRYQVGRTVRGKANFSSEVRH